MQGHPDLPGAKKRRYRKICSIWWFTFQGLKKKNFFFLDLAKILNKDYFALQIRHMRIYFGFFFIKNRDFFSFKSFILKKKYKLLRKISCIVGQYLILCVPFRQNSTKYFKILAF